MTNANQTQEKEADEIETTDGAGSSRVWSAAFLAGFTAYFALLLLPKDATIGTGIAFAGVAGMVTVVCCFILRSR